MFSTAIRRPEGLTVWSRLKTRVVSTDLRMALVVSTARIADRKLARWLRFARRLSLADISKDATFASGDPLSFGTFLGLEMSTVDVVRREYAALIDDLAARYRDISLPFPGDWAVEEQTGFFLYLAVRTLRPRTVVETGVANGHSSVILLNALRVNQSGMLHSFDVFADAGRLATDEERERWSFTVCDAREPTKAFRRAVRSLPPIDIFFHDSDHSYLGQLSEYQAVWPAMAPDGLILSDDADACSAFFDFAKRIRRPCAALIDLRKALGGVRVSGGGVGGELISNGSTGPVVGAHDPARGVA